MKKFFLNHEIYSVVCRVMIDQWKNEMISYSFFRWVYIFREDVVWRHLSTTSTISHNIRREHFWLESHFSHCNDHFSHRLKSRPLLRWGYSDFFFVNWWFEWHANGNSIYKNKKEDRFLKLDSQCVPMGINSILFSNSSNFK